MGSFSQLTPEDFVAKLREIGTARAYFVLDPSARRIIASHPELDPLAQELFENKRDFREHEAVFLQVGPETQALMGAFIHRSVRGQAAGGLRHWPYLDTRGFLNDGLRLALGMGRKNALAGLWWGGGKGVIARQPGMRYRDPIYRRLLYREYGSFVSSLRGLYVTAEDVGTSPQDMAAVFRTTRFVTCVPAEVGGSGNPSRSTAKGVVCAMEGALAAQNLGTLRDKVIAMQGLGNVSTFMIAELLSRGVQRIVASDINEKALVRAQERFGTEQLELSLEEPGDHRILQQPCDILSPNALGGVLSAETIPLIKASLICGCANNQLLDDTRDDQLLAKRGITLVPDFVANRMGIVNCANEQYGVFSEDQAISRHFDPTFEESVFQVTRRVLERAKQQHITTTEAANRLADEYAEIPHPIWGHRGRLIIDSLIRDRWQDQAVQAE